MKALGGERGVMWAAGFKNAMYPKCSNCEYWKKTDSCYSDLETDVILMYAKLGKGYLERNRCARVIYVRFPEGIAWNNSNIRLLYSYYTEQI